MSDLISRQAAINEFLHFADEHDGNDGLWHWTGIKAILESLPSAEPKKIQLSEEDSTFDRISRTAAIDALYHHFPHMTREECAAILHEVADVETEIIRCKDCKHWLHGHQCIELSVYGTVETLPDEHCSRAERRENG